MTPEYVARPVLVAIFFLLAVIGVLLNASIVLVNLAHWMRSQPLQALDIIITSLAMVRIILLLLYIVCFFDLFSGQPEIEMNMSPESILVLTMTVEFCNLWWGSVLCMFYCVKITNFKNRLFMRLKMNISRLVPQMLLFSLVLSILSSLPNKWFVTSVGYVNGTTGPIGSIKINLIYTLIIGIAGSIIPFVIFCISIGLVIVSLLRHNRNLGSRGFGFSEAQRDVHLNVIRNMFSFLLFYIFYFIGFNFVPVSIMSNKPLLTILCSIFYASFPSLRSISLVVINRELKNILSYCPPLLMAKGERATKPLADKL